MYFITKEEMVVTVEVDNFLDTPHGRTPGTVAIYWG